MSEELQNVIIHDYATLVRDQIHPNCSNRINNETF